MAEIIKEGIYRKLKWWILKFQYPQKIVGITEHLQSWYCVYIQLPEKDEDYRPAYSYNKKTGKMVKIAERDSVTHDLIDGFYINFEKYDDIIDVNGGITFGATDHEKTIIGWDYNHIWNQGSREDLIQIQEEIRHTIDRLIRYYNKNIKGGIK